MSRWQGGFPSGLPPGLLQSSRQRAELAVGGAPLAGGFARAVPLPESAADEKCLYVGNWDVKRKVVMCYRVEPDGALAGGEVFFDMTSEPGEQALDGLKVDQGGNVYVSGPGGIWIISPAGKHLGTMKAPELCANFAWSDEDGSQPNRSLTRAPS
jgi:hypothetical protein